MLEMLNVDVVWSSGIVCFAGFDGFENLYGGYCNVGWLEILCVSVNESVFHVRWSILLHVQIVC